MKWKDAKMSRLEYYIANINSQCWPQYKEKMPKQIQSRLTTTMSLGSQRALTILKTHSLKSRVEVASWPSPKYEDMQGMQ